MLGMLARQACRQHAGDRNGTRSKLQRMLWIYAIFLTILETVAGRGDKSHWRVRYADTVRAGDSGEWNAF